MGNRNTEDNKIVYCLCLFFAGRLAVMSIDLGGEFIKIAIVKVNILCGDGGGSSRNNNGCSRSCKKKKRE